VSPPEFDFSAVLGQMVEAKASDVHLTPGFAPAIRDRGRIQAMEGFPVLNSQQTREVVYGILNDDQGGPLHPPGLRMADALTEVRDSIQRNPGAKKGDSPRNNSVD